MKPHKHLAIDEEGFPLFGETRVQDQEIGSQILSHLEYAENRAFQTRLEDDVYLVEAFDEPLVIQSIVKISDSQTWEALAPYQVAVQFDPSTLTVDEWDRFHGLTAKGLPFVFSRKAQAQLFDQFDEFDDESITVAGRRFEIQPWMTSNPEIRKAPYWTQIYQTEIPGWEMNAPAPALAEMLPRLKLPKSRVLVLGCGSGNDAAFFAQHGHLVTAVDFSSEALARAKTKYKDLHSIRWIESDLFKLGPEHHEQYDIVFEHTCYCAIPPERRNELIRLWRRCLADQGQLLGVFFAMERRSGPPFGGTEWELRQRLKAGFQFHFWGRWRDSKQSREGKELFVYATKKAGTSSPI